jgi:hypothetical protein
MTVASAANSGHMADATELPIMLILLTALLAAQPVTAAVEPAKDDPMICKGRSESVVGTRIKPKKTCMKKSEWDYIERRTREELQQINQRGNNPGPAIGRDGD